MRNQIVRRRTAAALFMIFATGAHATTYVTTRFDDPASPSCTPADCSLRGAILAANAHTGSDIVVLQKGTYTLTQGSGSLLALGELDISDRLTIKGAGVGVSIITAANGKRLFGVQSTILDLQNLTIRNGTAHVKSATNGGCIYASGSSLTLTNVSAIFCSADGFGGGAYLSGSRMSISGTNFTSDSANMGGAIALVGASSLTMTHSSLLDRNSANWGGAIYSAGGHYEDQGFVFTDPVSVQISADSAIGGNRAIHGGGAIVNAAQAALDVSLLTSDQATSGALAAIYDNIAPGAVANASDGEGGAVYTNGGLRMARVHLHDNTAHDAGAIAAEGGFSPFTYLCPAIFIVDSQINNNSATFEAAGAIYSSLGVISLQRVSLDSNSITGTTSYGGAIAHQARNPDFFDPTPGAQCHHSDDIVLENVSISNNHAAFGGSVAAIGFFTHPPVLSSSSVFVNARNVTSFANTDTHGGFDMYDVALTTTNSIYTGGCSLVPGTLVSNGGNLQVAATPSCGFSFATGDQASVPLAPLALAYGNFGGQFPVVGITAATSPAIDFSTNQCLAADARGAQRPVDDCDTGAFEFGAPLP